MHDVLLKNGIIIPSSEIEITFSRSGGPGGQHVNKTSSRATLLWNVAATSALTEDQKNRVMQKLSSRLTTSGEFILHVDTSRSQHQNKEIGLKRLADEINNALHVPKKRMKTKISKAAKEQRLQAKSKRSEIKKMRKVNIKNQY